MALTVDCGEGKHYWCTGTISGSSYLFPQTADLPDRPCACRCHIQEQAPTEPAKPSTFDPRSIGEFDDNA